MAESEGGRERRPEGEGIWGGEGVVLVEDDAAEAEAAKGGPVDPTDVGDEEVRDGEVGLRHRDAQERRRPLPVESLPQSSPPRGSAAANAHLDSISSLLSFSW